MKKKPTSKKYWERIITRGMKRHLQRNPDAAIALRRA
jgi:hypothetical protein